MKTWSNDLWRSYWLQKQKNKKTNKQTIELKETGLWPTGSIYNFDHYYCPGGVLLRGQETL